MLSVSPPLFVATFFAFFSEHVATLEGGFFGRALRSFGFFFYFVGGIGGISVYFLRRALAAFSPSGGCGSFFLVLNVRRLLRYFGSCLLVLFFLVSGDGPHVAQHV